MSVTCEASLTGVLRDRIVSPDSTKHGRLSLPSSERSVKKSLLIDDERDATSLLRKQIFNEASPSGTSIIFVHVDSDSIRMPADSSVDIFLIGITDLSKENSGGACRRHGRRQNLCHIRGWECWPERRLGCPKELLQP